MQDSSILDQTRGK
jgi:hypothetical protein